jgi:hypothetical protein
MHVGDARLPEELRQAIACEIERDKLDAGAVLDSLTAVRRQTAMEITGIPKKHSLRSQRVILRNTIFISDLVFRKDPCLDDLALLVACVRALRYAGSGCSRGFGRLEASFLNEKGVDVTACYFERFSQEVQAGAGTGV